MATQTFKVDGTDYTRFIKEGSMKWSRNDIDADGSGRDMNGTMRRARVAIKVKLQFSCRNLTHEEMVSLNNALSPELVDVTYLDPRVGLRTATFYGSSVDAATMMSRDGQTIWSGASFNLIEV